MEHASIQQAAERYFQILQQVVLAADAGAIEVHLAAAFELGRVMLDLQVPPDDVTHIHHLALVRLSHAHPALPFTQVAERLSQPLMEMSMAYGMTFREQMELRYREMVISRFEKVRDQQPTGALMADIANDFNNLLGSIIGFAEMAGDELPADSSGRRNLNVMMDNLNALLCAEQAMQQEITLSERRLRTLVDNSPDIIARYDREGLCIFVNPAYTRETGLSAEQVLSSNSGDAGIWRPDMPSGEYGLRLQQVMVTGVADIILLEWLHPLGHRVSHEMYVVAEYDAEGHAIGTLAIGRDVTKRKAVEQQLLHQASYDVLSGLPNRRLFGDRLHEEIAKAERGGHRLAMLFIDLDRFKNVNDTQGHAVGDQLLVVAAQRIRGCVRESDTVARLGGDEFVAILPRVGEAAQLARIAQDMVAAMEKPFHLGEHKAYVSASIGIAIYPEDADTAETLLGCADQAMYAAKAAGRNGISFFTSGMQQRVQHRRQLLNDLREALEKAQFEVHYQPIIDIGSGQVLKAEALVRWRHPELGMVQPDQFIPLAEESGLIQSLSAWVLQEAMDTVKRWNTQAGEGGIRQISVNLSPVQFFKGRCDHLVIDLLQANGLASQHLAVEVTEGLLLEDCPSVMEQLRGLRASGIEIALDDFGTGYSTMSYLKKFDMDYLKIDRSFVRDMDTNPDDQAIAEAIVAMAHRLGLKVIAEGVETPRQATLLAAAGCEYAQGYLYARPLAAEAFLAQVAAAVPSVPFAKIVPDSTRMGCQK